MAKNKQSNLITSVKMLNISFINKYLIDLGIAWAIDPPPNYFSLSNADEIDYSV